jgi:hypothetical protein
VSSEGIEAEVGGRRGGVGRGGVGRGGVDGVLTITF